MNKKVVCLGLLVTDIIAKPVKKLPEKGKLELVDDIVLSFGGCAAICAINMAKMGADVTLIGKVGKDVFGDYMLSQLQDKGVHTEGITRSEKCHTSASCVIVGEDGERSFIHSVGANGMFCYEDVDFDVIQQNDIVFIGGTMLMPKFDGEDAAKMLKKSQEMGKFTVLDTAWDSQGRWMNVLKPCMEYIDLFMPSIDEAVELTGGRYTDPAEISRYFMDLGCKNVVIKLGDKGCYLHTGQGQEKLVPSFKVRAVDTTGAGDSFVSGFLTGLSKGWDFERCAVFANAVGANCVMDIGTNGVKSFEQIEQFIAERTRE